MVIFVIVVDYKVLLVLVLTLKKTHSFIDELYITSSP